MYRNAVKAENDFLSIKIWVHFVAAHVWGIIIKVARNTFISTKVI